MTGRSLRQNLRRRAKLDCESASLAKAAADGKLTGYRRCPRNAATYGADLIEIRRTSQQALGVGMLGVAQQLFGCADLHDFARIKHGNAPAQTGDDTEVVTDKKHRNAALARQPFDELDNLFLDRDIKRCRRLVRDQEFGAGRQRHRYHCALRQSAGELVWIEFKPRFRIGDADEAHELDGLRSRLPFTQLLVRSD
ncbi:MAG TPA: hypothetical protein VNZ93_19005 [Pseudorhodoplanes sp.]|nr:hypothetical protein [Pseudorhodoplanes sp.]HWV54665.1 hypothetical protein [Pseudorhodoplanes sp.]